MATTDSSRRAFRGVTYSQFDNQLGPKLLYSYPSDTISNELFENLSDFSIVGKQFCDKTITVKSNGIQFINYSIAIENTKYVRNTIMFSFGMVLDADVDSKPYETVLRKVSETFQTLELESEFLFQSETRELVHPLLRLLYTQIVESGEVFIEIDSSNIIATKLFSMPQEPALVEPYDVPILTINYSILSSLSWDITIRHVLQFIDGDNTISEIASTYPGMDINIVKRAIRTLLHYKCIYITDKLKFTNIYELSDHGQEFIIFLLQLQQQQHERMTSELNSSISVGMNGMSYMNGDITSHEHDHYHQNESPLRTIINTTTATTTTNTYDGVNQSSNIPTSNITTTNMSNNIDDNCIKTASQSQSQLGLGLQKLIQYCSLQNDDKTSSTIIFTLLTQFRPNRQLSEVLMYLRSQVPIFKINIRKFISYCIHHRMLFRIHEYPINLANQDSGTIFTYDVAPSDRHIATTTAATTATTNQPYMHTTSSTGNNYTDRNETPTGTTSYLNTNNLGGLSHNHLKSTSSMKPSNQTQHTRTETISIILNGKEHMDSICCKYKINHKVILSKPGVTVIYK